jgi:predicted Rossmann fold nucleotide-binding protein DprA/Smf involved in DNA uptake
MRIKAQLGNPDLLKLSKTAFLCSRQISAAAVLRCYDWAIAQREQGTCVLSGFHSQIEKDVLHYLIKGTQPIIIALARGLKAKVEPELAPLLNQHRLLIISPFDKTIKRVTTHTALVRNQLMLELANEIVVGYVNPKGNLAPLLKGLSKKVVYLS